MKIKFCCLISHVLVIILYIELSGNNTQIENQNSLCTYANIIFFSSLIPGSLLFLYSFLEAYIEISIVIKRQALKIKFMNKLLFKHYVLKIFLSNDSTFIANSDQNELLFIHH